MKIKEVFTEGFWAGVASGLTGMDYINKGGNFETSVDQLSDDDFKKVFAMSKQQFLNLDRKIQGKLLQQAAKKLNLGRTVAEPEVDQEPTQQPTVDQSDILDNIKVASAEPLIYQFNKTQYHLNSRGNWAKFPGEKEVSGTVAALLNKAADRDGY